MTNHETALGGRVGVVLPRTLPPHLIVPFAQRAEALGFDELWVVEDLGFKGGIAQAATVLAVTSRIHVGVGILPAAVRNAAFAAMEIATLAQLHPGRTTVGIGHGMPEWLRSVGAWPASPLTLLAEYAGAVRTLLRGEPGPERGRYVDVEGLVLHELPDVVPPVILGVRGPKSLALAGKHADGIILAEPAMPGYVAASAAIARPPAGSRGAAPLVVGYDLAAVNEDRRVALDALRPALAVLREPDWRPHLAQAGFADELHTLVSEIADPDEFVRALPEEWVSELTLAGTPDEVRRKIADRHAAGSTSVVMFLTTADPLAELDELALALGD
ncbi:MAG: LLM class flavin-dependent oxidoreductase [Glaciihabitans sp.]